MDFSEEQLHKLAPDSSTLENAKALASKKFWRGMLWSGSLFWGECKSKSISYYKTQLDLKIPAYKCNCPSRKKPCKHSLALIILAIQSKDDFKRTEDIPTTLMEWQDYAQQPPKELSPEELALLEKKRADQKAQNIAKRKAQMEIGFRDLESWLSDLIRQGMGRSDFQESEFWETFASRMVDTKLRGVSQKIKSLPLLQNGNTQWPEAMLAELGNLYLLAQGFNHIDDLPFEMQEQILSVAGVIQRRGDLLEEESVKDQWSVIGQLEGDNIDRGKYRRTWLQGFQSKKFALILEYDYRKAGFSGFWPIGKMINAELVFYPSAFPLRALVKEQEHDANFKPAECLALENFDAFLNYFTEGLSLNPWLFDLPFGVENVYTVFEKDLFYLVDENKKMIPLVDKENVGWKLIALSIDQPILVFGEWDGKLLNPLSAFIGNRFVRLQ